mmetsp:Transcript_69070/g.195741  ORF Transcript_69070/g.195741 Transcript_69070/m.195741 type:complete len:235 (+) Transcript_69070:331-1035(+)
MAGRVLVVAEVTRKDKHHALGLVTFRKHLLPPVVILHRNGKVADRVRLAIVERREQGVCPKDGHEDLPPQLHPQVHGQLLQQRDLHIPCSLDKLPVVQPEETEHVIANTPGDLVFLQVRPDARLLFLVVEASIAQLKGPNGEAAQDEHDQNKPEDRHRAGVAKLHFIYRVDVAGRKASLCQGPVECAQVEHVNRRSFKIAVLDPVGAEAQVIHRCEVPVAADVVGANHHSQHQI